MRADAAIVTEPTELEVVVAHKRLRVVEIEVAGRAAHGSRPHLGVDAIVKAGPVLTALGELDAGARRAHASAARARLGARLADQRRRGAVELSGALRPRARAAHAARGDGAERRGRARALLDGCRAADPELEAQARTLLVREPFEIADGAEIVSPCATPRRTCSARRRA